jgi:hypothetical protein
MAKVDKAAPKNQEPEAASDHTEKIKSQVLAKIGKPPRLDRVEVSRHHNGNYRVNIWEQPEPNNLLSAYPASDIFEFLSGRRWEQDMAAQGRRMTAWPSALAAVSPARRTNCLVGPTSRQCPTRRAMKRENDLRHGPLT